MTPHTDPARVASILLSRHDSDLISCKTIQRLWAGYGQICSITARARNNEAARCLYELCYGEGVDDSDSRRSNSKEKKNEKKEPVKGDTFQLILKLISPPTTKSAASRGGSVDEGHLRKMFSYEVEQYFYKFIVPKMDGLGVAKCLASVSGSDSDEDELTGCMAILMADLRSVYPVSGEKRSLLSSAQVHGSLEWLASFHARSWGLGLSARSTSSASAGMYILPPLEEYARREALTTAGASEEAAGACGKNLNVWLNGGYTYLSTRRKEYASLAEDDSSEWSQAFCEPFSTTSTTATPSTAEVAALCLTPRGRAMESLIHGDVKSENLFTTEAGGQVAFFDFQYVGLGLGVCDLAKLFTCSVPLEMLLGDSEDDDYLPDSLPMCSGERSLLERYRTSLLMGKEDRFYGWETFLRHWETALVDWCRFQASWGFWGNTEWLEARVRFILGDQGWMEWVGEDIKDF